MTAVAAANTSVRAHTTTSKSDDVPLEPVTPKPKPSPYVSTVGDKVGIGIMAAVAAALGGGVMGVIGGIDGSRIGMGVGLLLGGAVSAYGAVTLLSRSTENHHRLREEHRIDDEYGISTLELARKINGQADNDGSAATTAVERAEANPILASYLNKVDADKDDRTTDVEVARDLSKFDADRSGSITLREYDGFAEENYAVYPAHWIFTYRPH